MALTAKREAFAVAVAKGETATAAYRANFNTAGMAAKTVHESASRLLADRKVTARIAELRGPAMLASQIDAAEAFRQLGAVLRSDIRRVVHEDGSLIPVSDLDDETALAVASIEVREEYEGTGKDRKLVGYTKKLKFWNKNDAIDKAMKHLGLFERDNRQKQENLAIQINLVGPDPTSGRAGAVNVRANLVDGKRR